MHARLQRLCNHAALMGARSIRALIPFQGPCNKALCLSLMHQLGSAAMSSAMALFRLSKVGRTAGSGWVHCSTIARNAGGAASSGGSRLFSMTTAIITCEYGARLNRCAACPACDLCCARPPVPGTSHISWNLTCGAATGSHLRALQALPGVGAAVHLPQQHAECIAVTGLRTYPQHVLSGTRTGWQGSSLCARRTAE